MRSIRYRIVHRCPCAFSSRDSGSLRSILTFSDGSLTNVRAVRWPHALACFGPPVPATSCAPKSPKKPRKPVRVIVTVDSSLSSDELRAVRDALSGVAYLDGRATAGALAAGVKNNRQAAGDDRNGERRGWGGRRAGRACSYRRVGTRRLAQSGTVMIARRPPIELWPSVMSPPWLRAMSRAMARPRPELPLSWLRASSMR